MAAVEAGLDRHDVAIVGDADAHRPCGRARRPGPPLPAIAVHHQPVAIHPQPRVEPPAVEQQQPGLDRAVERHLDRSEEHTSELQSLMRTSYAVFCLKKKNITKPTHISHIPPTPQQKTTLTITSHQHTPPTTTNIEHKSFTTQTNSQLK